MKSVKLQGVRIVFGVFVLIATGQSSAADPLQDMEDCKSIKVENERLACFDAAAGQLKAAGMTADSKLKSQVAEDEVSEPAVKQEAVAVPSPQVRTGKQASSRFRLPFFGRGKADRKNNDEAPVSQGASASPAPQLVRDSGGNISSVSSTVTGVYKNGLGYTTLTLGNAQKWQTRESRIRAKVGDVVTVKRTRFGGYLLKVGSRSGVRVTRIDKPSLSKMPRQEEPREGVEAPASKKGGFLSRLNPFGRSQSDALTSGSQKDDPNFGKPAAVDTSEETFGRTRITSAERAANQQTITQTVSSVRTDPYDLFIITLESGQVWRQTEGRLKVRDGDKVVIQSAAMGSFLLHLEGRSKSVRVRRVD